MRLRSSSSLVSEFTVMAPTKPTRLASLLSKIHPPLPMNPRESQQLAEAISKSFQEQLDKEHLESSNLTRGRSDLHLSSILANPHFSTIKIQSASNSARPRSTSTGPRPSTLEKLQTYLLDDMLQQFRQQVAAGEATLESAKRCLKYYQSPSKIFSYATIGGKHPTTSLPPPQYQVGQLVCSWLWSTGLEESMEFAYDSEFLVLIVRALYAEGQAKRVADWGARLNYTLIENQAQGLLDNELVLATSTLIRTAIDTECAQHGVNSALRSFHQHACNIQGPELSRMTLKDAARNLSQAVVLPSAIPIVDVNLYDKFANSLPKYLHGKHLEYRLAWMKLKHPQSSNPDMALAFIRRARPFEQTSAAQIEAAIRSHIEVAKVLLEQNRSSEAEEVIKLMTKKFTKQHRIKAADTPNTKHILDEMPILQQLLTGAIAAT